MKYFGALAAAGYARKRRESDSNRGVAGRAVFSLARDTGPLAPKRASDGSIFDPNLEGGVMDEESREEQKRKIRDLLRSAIPVSKSPASPSPLGVIKSLTWLDRPILELIFKILATAKDLIARAEKSRKSIELRKGR